MILYIISKIYKSGADIELLPNGKLKLINHEKVDPLVLESAKPIFHKIEEYYQSVHAMDNPSKTMWKINMVLNGWMQNEKIRDFLNGDETSLMMCIDYQAKLAQIGWKDVYSDWRVYEDAETHLIKQEVFKRAVEFFKKEK